MRSVFEGGEGETRGGRAPSERDGRAELLDGDLGEAGGESGRADMMGILCMKKRKGHRWCSNSYSRLQTI